MNMQDMNGQMPPQPQNAQQEVEAIEGSIEGAMAFLDISAQKTAHYDKIEDGLNGLYDMDDFQGTKVFMEMSGLIAFMKRKDAAQKVKVAQEVARLEEVLPKAQAAAKQAELDSAAASTIAKAESVPAVTPSAAPTAPSAPSGPSGPSASQAAPPAAQEQQETPVGE